MFIIHYQNIKDILGGEHTIQYTKKRRKRIRKRLFCIIYIKLHILKMKLAPAMKV